MKIEVTPRLMGRGRPNDCGACPVALAIQEKFPESFVFVEHFRAFIDGAVYYLPNAAVRFIERYDLGAEVEPFAFELAVEGGGA